MSAIVGHGTGERILRWIWTLFFNTQDDLVFRTPLKIRQNLCLKKVPSNYFLWLGHHAMFRNYIPTPQYFLLQENMTLSVLMALIMSKVPWPVLCHVRCINVSNLIYFCTFLFCPSIYMLLEAKGFIYNTIPLSKFASICCIDGCLLQHCRECAFKLFWFFFLSNMDVLCVLKYDV